MRITEKVKARERLGRKKKVALERRRKKIRGQTDDRGNTLDFHS